MATKTKTKRPAKKRSLKITSSRAKKAAAAKKKTTRKSKKLVIKTAKLGRMLKKGRILVRKALKAATKGMTIGRIPEKLYKHIDTAIAKNEALAGAIQTAVVAAVNEIGGAPAGNGKVKKARKPRAKKEKAPVAEKKAGKNGNGKTEKAPATEPAATAAA